MTDKKSQRISTLRTVNEVASLLPDDVQWSVEITDDSFSGVPPMFFVYPADDNARSRVKEALSIVGFPDEESDIAGYYKYNTSLWVVIYH